MEGVKLAVDEEHAREAGGYVTPFRRIDCVELLIYDVELIVVLKLSLELHPSNDKLRSCNSAFSSALSYPWVILMTTK